MRQVCRSWRTGINAYYSNLEELFATENDPLQPKVYKHSRIANDPDSFATARADAAWSRKYSFRTNNEIQQFRKHFDESHLNKPISPFVGRAVDASLAVKDLPALTRDYGKFIWHLELFCPVFNNSAAEFCYNLQQVLMPQTNLKSLGLTCPLHFSRRVTCKDVEEEIKNFELPAFSELVMLKFEHVPVPLALNLLHTNKHITSLEIIHNTELQNYMEPKHLRNLIKLSVSVCSEKDFEYLYKVGRTWKLEKISLDFSKCTFIKWSRIFKLLKKCWEATASFVIIIFPKAVSFEDKTYLASECRELKLQMQKVTKLKLEMENHVTLDFILPMQSSLKELNITVRVHDVPCWKQDPIAIALRKKQVLDFLGYSGYELGSNFLMSGLRNCIIRECTMLDSNIWRLFEKLDLLDYDLDLVNGWTNVQRFTRSQWMWYEKHEGVREAIAIRGVNLAELKQDSRLSTNLYD